MQVIQNERVIPIDVDETLVMHSYFDGAVALDVLDPHSNVHVTVYPNQNMIRLLKDEFARGAYIIVWSRGGYAWADAILAALNLQNHVNLVLTKPLVYMDDTSVYDWLKDRVYIGPTVIYKQRSNE
jgi:hypothetical protein